MEQNIYNTHEAKTNLSKLIARVEAGEEIIIARAGKPAVRMVVIEPERPERIRKRGDLKGKIWYADDWDSPETNASIGADFIYDSVFPSESHSEDSHE